MRFFAILLAAFALAGCFMSDEALYPEAGAACPFTQQVTMASTTLGAGGEILYTPASSIGAEGGQCVQRDLVMTETPPRTAIMTPLEGHWYIVQERDAERGAYRYGLIHWDGARLASYQPQCWDFAPEALTELGLPPQWDETQPEDGSCRIATAAQLESLMRAWIRLGRPPQSIEDVMPAAPAE